MGEGGGGGGHAGGAQRGYVPGQRRRGHAGTLSEKNAEHTRPPASLTGRRRGVSGKGAGVVGEGAQPPCLAGGEWVWRGRGAVGDFLRRHDSHEEGEGVRGGVGGGACLAGSGGRGLRRGGAACRLQRMGAGGCGGEGERCGPAGRRRRRGREWGGALPGLA
jgi:hypothetical protein